MADDMIYGAPRPAERIKKFLTTEELGIFIDFITKKRWAKMETAKTIAECRGILAGIAQDAAAKAVKAGLPVAKLIEIAGWEDPSFEVYALGPVSASVCTSLNIMETTMRLNVEHPTGIDSLWSPSEDKAFASGQPMPCACENRPDTHKHWLFHC